jgi:hypothetical protein
MSSKCALVLSLLAVSAHAADFNFSVVGESKVLSEAAVASFGKVERCMGKLEGPVIALLFMGHGGLLVDVRAAPQGTAPCIKKVLLALDVGTTVAHESVIVVAGTATGPGEWPTSSIEVYDPDVPMQNPFDKPVRRPNVEEARAHAPLFRRCSKGESVVTIMTRSDGSVAEVTGTKDACVLEVVKGMQFPVKHNKLRLELRLD